MTMSEVRVPVQAREPRCQALWELLYNGKFDK
jgi:hypothetical protein